MVAISPAMDMVFPHTPYLDRPLQHQMLLDNLCFHNVAAVSLDILPQPHVGYHPELPLFRLPNHTLHSKA
jgi:hypothetical protein